MTVNTTNITSGPYTGNGALDEYSYDFRVEDKSQLTVYETTDLGVQSLLVVDTDYTVNDVGVDGGGTITRLAGNLPTDYVWYIRSAYVENQLTDFSSQGAFFPDVHESQFDHLTFLVQQITDGLSRAFTFAKEKVAPVGVDLTLPEPVANSIAAMWNSAGDALEIGPTADDISNAQGYANAAAASAADAATTYDTFDERYLGEHASDPTNHNGGGPALDASDDGIEYWDSTLKVRKTFNGSTLLWGLTSTSVATNAVDVNLADAGHFYSGGNSEAAHQEVGAVVIHRNQFTGFNYGAGGSGYTVSDVLYCGGTNLWATVTGVDGSGAVTNLSTSVVDKRASFGAGTYPTTGGTGTGCTFTLSGFTLNTVEIDETQTLTNKTHTDAVLNGVVSGTGVDTTVTTSTTKVPRSSAVKDYVDAVPQLVMLDVPELLVNAAPVNDTWTDFDMSVDGGTEAAAAAAAGATIAILNFTLQETKTGAILNSRLHFCLRKNGSTASTVTSRVAHTMQSYDGSGGNPELAVGGQAMVKLDGNSDFEYLAEMVSGTLDTCRIYLVGYYA